VDGGVLAGRVFAEKKFFEGPARKRLRRSTF
jgi:hypothetical protein